jgi:hypothetical protein
MALLTLMLIPGPRVALTWPVPMSKLHREALKVTVPSETWRFYISETIELNMLARASFVTRLSTRFRNYIPVFRKQRYLAVAAPCGAACISTRHFDTLVNLWNGTSNVRFPGSNISSGDRKNGIGA